MEQVNNTNNTDVEVIESDNALVAAFSNPTGNALYSSRKIESMADKAALYNAINNPDVQISDHVNQVIVMQDVIIQQVQISRRDASGHETGEVVTAPRVTIVDVEGHTYSCVSVGIYNALCNLKSIFGAPSWPDGLPVVVRQINRGSNRILTLDAAL